MVHHVTCHIHLPGMINHREANAIMRTASGIRYPIKGYGDLPLTFRSSCGEVPLLPCNVAHVPSLSYHIIFLRVAAVNGHTYTGNKNGVTVKFKTGETLFFPSVGRLNFLYANRPGALDDENANAVVAPGPEPGNRGTPVDINAFHAAHTHAHEESPAQGGQADGYHPQGRAARMQGLHNGEGHQDASSLEDTRVYALG